MKRLILSLVVALSAVITYAQKVHPNISSQKVNVTIDPSVIKGPIKPMNAVNNGPNVAEGTQQIEDFRILNIPFSRTHDSNIDGYYGYHLWISQMFSLILTRILTRNLHMISAKQISLSRQSLILVPR